MLERVLTVLFEALLCVGSKAFEARQFVWRGVMKPVTVEGFTALYQRADGPRQHLSAVGGPLEVLEPRSEVVGINGCGNIINALSRVFYRF